jgi:hypothetical protein
MKRLVPPLFGIAPTSLAKTMRITAHGVIAILLLAGCTATVVRWNSVRMREEIMAYYNDEIMDNLIRMKNGLPFVHVDISSVSAAGVSQVSGTVGGGETESFTRTSPSMIGVLHTISRAAMKPFSYSATPLHSDTLTMTAVPVIGQLPVDTQITASESPTPEVVTKVTEVRKPPTKEEPKGELEKTTIEKSPKPVPTTTIYAIYEFYRKSLVDNALVYSEGLIRPNKEEYVPGTLKWRGSGYYYIQKSYQEQYRQLCMNLFTQGRGKPSSKAVNAEFQVYKAGAPSVQPVSRP